MPPGFSTREGVFSSRTLVASLAPVDLKSGYPYWAIKNGIMRDYPQLVGAEQTDVLIVGGGITGALICEELVSHGHRVAIVDQRQIGWGSTAASTALLQYEIDTPLSELTELYGWKRASLAYRACHDAIGELGCLARTVCDVDFAEVKSLYYASSPSDAEALALEYELRRQAGFNVELLASTALEEEYGLHAPSGILSHVAARVDPYRMTYRLMDRHAHRGVKIFDCTEVTRLDAGQHAVVAHTSSGATIEAQHVILAAGYAAQKWLKEGVAKNRSSYAFITDPLDAGVLGALSDTIVWESARPYIYLRSTGDRRLLVGGEDDAVDVPVKRDASVGHKIERLQAKLHAAFPRLVVKPAFAWGGTFAETEDGLPYFGSHPRWGPRVHFAMSYGGNGITYSVLGAKIIRATIEGAEHELAELFSFDRVRLRQSVKHSFIDKLRDRVAGLF